MPIPVVCTTIPSSQPGCALSSHSLRIGWVSFMCRGNLILDCRDFNESGVEQCFPDSTSNPQPCTPASSTQTYPPLKQARCLRLTHTTTDKCHTHTECCAGWSMRRV